MGEKNGCSLLDGYLILTGAPKMGEWLKNDEESPLIGGVGWKPDTQSISQPSEAPPWWSPGHEKLPPPPPSPRRGLHWVVVLFGVIVHLVTSVGYVGLCIYLLAVSSGASSHCEDVYHLSKYVELSIAFNLVSLCTYFIFTAGNETTRGRATAFTMVHLAFSLWGSLTWSKLDALCTDPSAHNDKLLLAHHITVFYNGAYFL